LESLLARLLPEPLAPRWALEEFFVSDLTRFAPGQSRDDVQVEWFTHTRQLAQRHWDFLKGHMGRQARWLWLYRLNYGGCLLALASWGGAVRHFLLVQLTRVGSLRRYWPLMQPNSCYIGPAYTEAAARGRGIYPYVLREALQRVKEAGFHWACITAAHDNEPSLKGIRKDGNWVYIGRVLLRRHPFGLYYHIHGATVDNRDLTAQLLRSGALEGAPNLRSQHA
jgi:ribosomal protein S18 acetylase RimI-like enzyme